jgi:plastocyanin
MRKFAIFAGLALVACGGGEPAQDQAAAPEAAAPEAAAPVTGATHDVNMVLEGTAYLYVPSTLTIASGDRVVFHNVSGGPHNTQFWPDSIPAGAADALSAGMPDQMAPLGGPLLIGQDETYTVTFAGTPAGEYRFYCLPHLANKMTGIITVQ